MKKIYIVVNLCILIILMGCNSTSNKVELDNSKIKITTSNYPLYLITKDLTKDIKNIVLDNISNTDKIKITNYELTKQDEEKINNSQILIINGFGIEKYNDYIKNKFDKIKVIEANQGIQLIKDLSGARYNPYVWLSITDLSTQIRNIANNLALYDAKNSEIYKKNADDLILSVSVYKETFKDRFANLNSKNIVLMDGMLSYLFRDVDLKPVIESESKSFNNFTPEQINILASDIQKNNVISIYLPNDYNKDILQAIVSKTKIRYGIVETMESGALDIKAGEFLKEFEKFYFSVRNAVLGTPRKIEIA